MPSPFPGMNPYLEQPDVWHEFHEAYCGAIMTELSRSLPEPYYVRGDATTATVVPPARTRFSEADTFTETTIEIHDSRLRRVVTAIEVLSPSNKHPDDDFDGYATKRLKYLHSGISLVEIDLLRGGTRAQALKPLPPADYFVLVARPDQHHETYVWPIALRQPLPTIPVPLAPPDPDLPLDLQQILHAAYDARSFRMFIYEAEPTPPLSNDDAEWARSVLTS
jgi:hypothetical protein